MTKSNWDENVTAQMSWAHLLEGTQFNTHFSHQTIHDSVGFEHLKEWPEEVCQAINSVRFSLITHILAGCAIDLEKDAFFIEQVNGVTDVFQHVSLAAFCSKPFNEPTQEVWEETQKQAISITNMAAMLKSPSKNGSTTISDILKAGGLAIDFNETTKSFSNLAQLLLLTTYPGFEKEPGNLQFHNALRGHRLHAVETLMEERGLGKSAAQIEATRITGAIESKIKEHFPDYQPILSYSRGV